MFANIVSISIERCKTYGASKMAKMIPSTRKVIATISWDSQIMILIDYDEKRTITGYADLLDLFGAKRKRKTLQK